MREPFVQYVERQYAADTVLIACGLPATNKTETTEVVARLKGHTILRTDVIRLEVLEKADIFDEKEAANMDKRRLVYDEMFRRADEIAAGGRGVILDATFVTRALRSRAVAVAVKHNRTLVIQQTSCSEAYSLQKIEKRSRENYESNALSPVAYFNNVKKFEPIDLEILKQDFPDLKIVHLVVDTNSDLEEEWFVIECVETKKQALAGLRRRR